METSEYDFHYEAYRRVPMNSATTQKDFTESSGTFSTYTVWPRSVKRTMTTTYIDATKMLGHPERPYTTKDLFPKGKNRRKPLNSSEKKMNARDAYMSLLPTDASTIRSEKTNSSSSTVPARQPSCLPEVPHKTSDIPNKRSIMDENSQSKYNTRPTTHVNSAWIRRYKSINESQILSDLLRDQSYRDKILLKKRLAPFSSPSSSSITSSLIKRKRDK